MLSIRWTIRSEFFAWTRTAKPIAMRYRMIPPTSQRYAELVRSAPRIRISPIPVIPWTIAPGMTILRSM